MTLRKDIPTRSTLHVAPSVKPAKSSATPHLIGLAVEIPPVAYAAVTGQLPGWARWWMVGWLSLWLLVNVVQAAHAREGGAA